MTAAADSSAVIAKRKGNLAPVSLFVYNRLSHTKKTIESLANNELARETELIIHADGPKDQRDAPAVQHVRHYIRAVAGFKRVVVKEHERNLGLSASIISGVTDVVNAYGRIIVLEDDMITSPYFLRFMNDALDLYEDESAVVSIHGYSLPLKEQLPNLFFLPGADCWGWATWRRGWEVFRADSGALIREIVSRGMERDFDFNGTFPYMKMLRDQDRGKIDSWGIRWRASAVVSGKLTLYPGKSLVRNIGLDGSGTHCGVEDSYDTELPDGPVAVEKIPVEQSAVACRLYEEFLARCSTPSLLLRSNARVRSCVKRIVTYLGGGPAH
jgi:hypothetical protein